MAFPTKTCQGGKKLLNLHMKLRGHSISIQKTDDIEDFLSKVKETGKKS